MNYPIYTERADLFDHKILIAMEAEIRGTALEEEVQSAFREAVQAHEILNTKVRMEKDGRAWYVPGDGAQNTLQFTKGDLRSLLIAQEKIRFRIEDGEFLRAFLIPGEEKFRALFLMHHLAGDGKSLVIFIDSFLRALSGEKLCFEPISLFTPEKMPGRLPLITRGFLKLWNKKWQKEKKIFTFRELQDSYDRFWACHETELTVRTFETSALLQQLREIKEPSVHFTAWVMTKYLETHPGKRDMGLAVDARPPQNGSMCNLTTGISVETGYREDRSFSWNARRVQKAMDRKLQRPVFKYFILHFMAGLDPCLVDAFNFCHAGSYESPLVNRLSDLFGYGEKTKNLSLSNLGNLKLQEQYGPFRVTEFLFIPPVISYGKNVMGIVTLGQHTQVVIHRCSRKDSR